MLLLLASTCATSALPETSAQGEAKQQAAEAVTEAGGANAAESASAAQPSILQNEVLKALRVEIRQAREAIAREREHQVLLNKELDSKGIQLAEQQAKVQSAEQTLARERSGLEERFRQSLESQDVLLDDSLGSYWRIAEELERLRQTERAIEREHADIGQRVAESRRHIFRLNNNLHSLEIREKQVLVRLVFSSLRTQATVEGGNTIDCPGSMTLQACAELSEKSALQKGVEHFRKATLQKLIAELASDLDPDALSLDVQVDEHAVLSQEFRGRSSHYTKLAIALRIRPDQKVTCQLVGIAQDQCSSYFSHREQVDGLVLEGQEGSSELWVPLTVRSNVFEDEVFINGAGYGPTPLSVILPKGEYHVEVRKDGYRTASKDVSLESGHVLRLELTRAHN